MTDVSLSAAVDTSGVASGMAAIENQVSKSARTIGETLSRYLTAGAFLAELQKIIGAAENIHREAERFHIDAEQLQVVTNAAKQLGLDMGQVARAMNLLEINAQKAIDPTTKQALAMEHLGISAKQFAALNPEQQFLALADAYKNSAQDGQAYADVAELIGRKNTELIPLLSQGSQAILDQGKSMRVMSNEEIDDLHKLAIERDKFIAEIDSGFARLIVSFGGFMESWRTGWYAISSVVVSAGDLVVGGFKVMERGLHFDFKGAISEWKNWGKAALDQLKSVSDYEKEQFTKTTPPGPRVSSPSAGGGAPIGLTDISAGGGAGLGGGRAGGLGSTAEWLSGLNAAQKINTLLKERQTIVDKLNSADEQGDQHAATRYALEQQRDTIDQNLVALRQQLNIEEQKGIDVADRQIQKSQGRVDIDQLDLQIRDLANKGNEYGAFLLQNERTLLAINLDFDEKIKAAIDKANEARAQGLELTAEENEALAQQLETERQANLALEQQRQAREREIISRGPNPLTVNALAQGNLRLGATSNVYAAALAASRGIQPGTPEYDRLVQRIEAQDQLANLQGRNINDPNRTALVNWYEQQQQREASQRTANQHQADINYWGALASGRAPSQSALLNFFGFPELAGITQFTPLSQGSTNAGIQSQINLLAQLLVTAQQIAKNTTLVSI